MAQVSPAPTPTPKPPKPSLALVLFNLLVISLGVSAAFWWLFNNTIADTYHYTEMPFKLAFTICTPITYLYFVIQAQVNITRRYQVNMLSEATLARVYLSYIVENTYIIATKGIDKSKTVDYNSATVNEGTNNDNQEQAN